MSAQDITTFIPALKKTVAFPDDLVKKLAGITPIQRAIDKTRKLGIGDHNIHLLTDSEEVRLIAERNGIGCYWEPGLVLDERILQKKLYQYILGKSKQNQFILILSPYAVLLTTTLIEQTLQALAESKKDILKPFKRENIKIFDDNYQNTFVSIIGVTKQTHLVECKAFTLLKSEAISKGRKRKLNILPWEVDHDLYEISSLQDWWVCEKLLQRKRIVFRVIGNDEVGMGHIYRTLSLAHEISDHEILFVSDYENKVAVNKLAGYDYWLGIFNNTEITDEIINLNPDLVINDILDTDETYINKLKNQNIKIANFEDLGSGASLTDLTINELYDEPILQGNNIKWGHKFFFIRNEFETAQPQTWTDEITNILITFGGTDQNNLTQKSLEKIITICEKFKIKISIVVGQGYVHKKELNHYLEKLEYKNIEFTFGTGVISNIMEETQIAISSNGRTVYELAHMNIPSIIISHHRREYTHSFANENNGFINLGLYRKGETETSLIFQLKNLFNDNALRRSLFEKMVPINFTKNKIKVLELISELIEQ